MKLNKNWKNITQVFLKRRMGKLELFIDNSLWYQNDSVQ